MVSLSCALQLELIPLKFFRLFLGERFLSCDSNFFASSRNSATLVTEPSRYSSVPVIKNDTIKNQVIGNSFRTIKIRLIQYSPLSSLQENERRIINTYNSRRSGLPGLARLRCKSTRRRQRAERLMPGRRHPGRRGRPCGPCSCGGRTRIRRGRRW